MTKWAEIINSEGSVGILWQTEDDFGFSANPTEENKELVKDLQQRQKILNQTSLPSEVKYEVIFDVVNSGYNCLSIVSEGDTEEMRALLAVANPQQYSSQDLHNLLQPAGEYSLVYDDDKNVIGLVWDSDEDVLVRENGNWVEPVEEDQRIYGGSFRYVNDQAVNLFDKLVKDNPTPPLDFFKEVSLD